MEQYQYASKEHSPLLYNIFHMVTGKVKPIHEGRSKVITRIGLVAMTIQDLRIVIYTIRNLYDPHVFKNKVVYPEALNNVKTVGRDSYTLKWQLSNYNHFRNFH